MRPGEIRVAGLDLTRPELEYLVAIAAFQKANGRGPLRMELRRFFRAQRPEKQKRRLFKLWKLKLIDWPDRANLPVSLLRRGKALIRVLTGKRIEEGSRLGARPDPARAPGPKPQALSPCPQSLS